VNHIDLINQFVERMDNIAPAQCELMGSNFQEMEYDALINLTINGKVTKFAIEVKNRILISTFNQELLDRIPFPIIYLANYIPLNTRNSLRNINYSYADSVGNIFISHKDVFIDRETNKSGRMHVVKQLSELGKAGLKVVFQFLIEEELLNKSYQSIADEALVTKDTVGRTIKYLLHEKYILKKNERNYVFNRREELFELWVHEYNRKLKPKLHTEKFSSLKQNMDWTTSMLPRNTYYGGIRAAEILTGEIIANEQIMYSALDNKDLLPALMNKTPVVRDSQGELIVRQIFWKEPKEGNISKVVHPILIYADLISSDDPRVLAVAEKIYKKEIEKHVDPEV